MITLKVSSTGTGACSLSGRDGDGLTVGFESEQPLFLTWKSFKQLLTLRLAQNGKPPQPATVVSPRPMPLPAEAK